MNLLKRALKELKLGNYQEGEALLHDYLKIKSNDPTALLNLGLCYIEKEMYSNSVEVLERCIEACPNFYSTYIALGFSYEKSGSFSKAIETLETAIKLEPKNFMALNNLGIVYAEMGDLKKSIELISKANKINPHEPGILLSLARAYESDNNLIKAAELYRQVKGYTKNHTFEVMAEEGLTRISTSELEPCLLQPPQ